MAPSFNPLRADHNSEEYGQANVHLIVANGLRRQHGDAVDLHFCSFAKLASRVPEGMTFHPIEGKGMLHLSTEKWQKAHP